MVVIVQKKITTWFTIISLILSLFYLIDQSNPGQLVSNQSVSISSTIASSDSLSLEQVQGVSTSISLDNLVTVKKVIDGDTFELEDGRKVRLIGVDTPETKHPIKGVQCFGQEASAFAKQLIEGQKVRLEKDKSQTDRYGRVLAYVYLGDLFINEELVKKGYALAKAYPPDIAKQAIFEAAEEFAKEQKLGLWGTCPVNP